VGCATGLGGTGYFGRNKIQSPFNGLPGMDNDNEIKLHVGHKGMQL